MKDIYPSGLDCTHITLHNTKMSYNLFLDDNKNPKDIWSETKSPEYAVYNWVTVKDYESFIDIIKEQGLPTRVSFDHNLNEEHYSFDGKKKISYDVFEYKTGYDCAVWLIEYCIDYSETLPLCKVHCDKGKGKSNIESLLENFISYQSKLKKK